MGLVPHLAGRPLLVRQLASYLFVPVLVVDTTGTVVFYNEPAERILGVRFDETGRIDREEADQLLELSDDPTASPDDRELLLTAALQQRRPGRDNAASRSGDRRRRRGYEARPRDAGG
jgi:PAS domain-containing protein